MTFPFLDGLDDVELQALRLDGESYRLGDAHLSIGTVDCPESRAVAMLAGRPERVIAAGWTAAWIWGASANPPVVAEFLVGMDARWRDRPGGVRITEAVVRPGDIVQLGTARVTSPLRTTLDLARFGADDTTDVLRHLAADGGFALAEALQSLDAGTNLPYKRRAASRLVRALDDRISRT